MDFSWKLLVWSKFLFRKPAWWKAAKIVKSLFIYKREKINWFSKIAADLQHRFAADLPDRLRN